MARKYLKEEKDMNKFRKLTATLLVLASCANLLIGCGSGNSSSSDPVTPSNSAAESQGSSEKVSVTWPNGPITIVCPSRAGGFADIHARILSDYIQRTTGASCVVVNNADGGGTAGPEQVRSSAADGSTLLYMHTSFPISTFTGAYSADINKDFTAVSSVANGGNNALVVKATAPWNTLDELIEAAKANPGTITWGSMAGATSHFMMAMVEEASGAKFKMVDAGSEAEKITAVLGGVVDVVCVGLSNAVQFMQSVC